MQFFTVSHSGSALFTILDLVSATQPVFNKYYIEWIREGMHDGIKNCMNGRGKKNEILKVPDKKTSECSYKISGTF